MPDLVLHIIIPLVALLLFYDRRCRTYVLLLSPLAVLPDIDHLVSADLARVLLHNIFVLLPPLLVGVYAYITGHKKASNIALIAVFYLGSHVLLDLFQGGVALFYPVTVDNYAITFDFVLQNQQFKPDISLNVTVPSARQYVKGDVVSSVSVAIAITFVLVAMLRELLTRRS